MSLSAERSRAPKDDKPAIGKPPARSGKNIEQIRLIPESALAEVKDQLEKEHLRAENLQREMLYLQADFENYRRRVASEIEARSAEGKLNLLSDILVIADQLELATRAARESGAAKEITEGLAMTLANLNKVMQAQGLTKIESVGRRFDPNLHEAVERVPRDDVPDGQVVEEVRAGFTMGEKVIRPSVVKVSCPTVSSKGERGAEVKE